MRQPIAIGFYPKEKKHLENDVKNLLVPKKEIKKPLGLIAPHAGYVYSGSVAGTTYASARTDKKNFILLGPNHTGRGSPISLSKEDWKTPLGDVKINQPLAERFSKIAQVDESAHKQEHSLEVQLPFMQAMYQDFTFLPLCLMHLEFHELEKLAFKLLDENSFYIASSDFIHFGPMYGYEPVSSGIKTNLGWVKSVDMRMIDLVCKLKAKEFYDEVAENEYSICGYIPITLITLVMKRLGARGGTLIDYKTSYEVREDPSFVSYAGIVFE